VRRLCKVMALHPSGYYAWRIIQNLNARLKTGACSGISSNHGWKVVRCNGCRKVHDDRREPGETCDKTAFIARCGKPPFASKLVTVEDRGSVAGRLLW
jgi:rRNA maturation endonuclease Nob1